MLGKRIINTATGAACTTDTVQILGDTSCIAYYKMSDATDETGSYDGTASNVNFNVAGKFGNAGEFNGSSSYISASNPLSGFSASGNYSVSVWVNINSTSATSGGTIFGSYVAPSAYPPHIWITTSTLRAHGYQILDFSNNLSTGTWYNIVLVNSGTNTSMYINGNLQTPASTTTWGLPTAGDFVIGGLPHYFDGSIDQVRIFDRAITSNEVTTLYNEVQCIPTIVPTDHFNPVIWDGAVGSGSRDFSGVGFQPDLVWAKRTSSGDDHHIYDSVRGAGATKVLASNKTAAEPANNAATYGYLDAFLPDGFSTVSGSANNAFFNENNQSFVSWNWKAGGTAVSNTDGTITSQVSANTDAGFSIVSWLGGSASSTIGHGLGTAPQLIIAKRISGAISEWCVNGSVGGLVYGTNKLVLNSSNAIANDTNEITSVSSSTFTIGGSTTLSNDTIAYCFSEVEGYSKLGSYVGTGANGNSIVTGFRPAYVMVKCTTTTQGWSVSDNKRSPNNPVDKYLEPHSSGAEQSGQAWYNIDYNSNGFTVNGSDNYTNGSNQTYIFMAFAEENVQPEPELANSFNVVTYTGNGSTQAVTGLGFEPDLVWIKSRSVANNHFLYDTIRGVSKAIYIQAEVEITRSGVTSFNSNGFTLGTSGDMNANNTTYVAWAWKASNDSTINQDGSITSIVSANPAAGFSVVSYTGNGSTGTIGHGLSSAPSMLIIKNRSSSTNWVVGSDEIGWDYSLNLNDTSTAGLSTNRFNSTAPTSAVFSVGATSVSNGNNNDYIAYCFHSTDNQKVGSYTGAGYPSTVTVTTGFQPRWIMIKATDLARNWVILDSERGYGNNLSANISNAEYLTSNGQGQEVEFTSTGFIVRANSSWTNNSGTNYIYLAIA